MTAMTYEQTLSYIHARPKLPPRDSLIRMAPVLDAIGHPERELSFVHITGTNGKGSSAAMISSALQCAGYKTGLFISPFILDFRERMQIDRQMIPQETLVSLLEELLPLLDRLDSEGKPISEFELDTILALMWFAREKTDIVVMEVGIGGEHDATNVIPRPRLSVIMGIGLDHMATLGSTVEEIAKEKSGIIKGNPVVCYPVQQPEVMEILLARCAETGSAFTLPSPYGVEVLEETLGGSRFRYCEEEYTLPLIGHYQLYNAITVIEGLKLLGVPPHAIKKGIANVKFPVRMELLQRDPPILIDGAHNPHGMTALCDSVKRLNERPVTAVVGMIDTQDVSETLAILAPICGHIVLVPIDNPHTNRPQRLADTLDQLGFTSVTVCDTDRPNTDFYREALETARALDPDGLLLCCGSLYLASDLRRIFFPNLD